jgi:hypothetical protein
VDGVTVGTAGPLVTTPTWGEPLAIDPEGEEAGRQRLHRVLTGWARGGAMVPARFDLDGVDQWEVDHGQGSSHEG